MGEQRSPKVYVAVKADFNEDGIMLPREITWEDGTKYAIDRVLDIRQAAAMKAGGQGDRYRCRCECHCEKTACPQGRHQGGSQRSLPLR